MANAVLSDSFGGSARSALNAQMGIRIQVLVRTLKKPQPTAGLVTKPAPTAVMAAWALGYWARKGVGHADAVLFAGLQSASLRVHSKIWVVELHAAPLLHDYCICPIIFWGNLSLLGFVSKVCTIR